MALSLVRVAARETARVGMRHEHSLCWAAEVIKTEIQFVRALISLRAEKIGSEFR